MSFNQKTLSVAIGKAVHQPKKLQVHLNYKHVSNLAKLAQDVNEESISFLAEQAEISDERHYLTVQLLRASFDHGRALLFLLRTNPNDMGAPCLALHRAQIESFLRAIFFGFIANEEQLEDFLAHDEGIRVRTAKGKWRKIGTIELSGLVEEKINELSDEDLEDANKFARMVENAWDPLCGFVHGGRAIKVCYVDTHGQIGCSLPPALLFQVVSNCFVVTNFGLMTVLAKLYGSPGIDTESRLSIAFDKFVKYQHELAKLDRSFGP